MFENIFLIWWKLQTHLSKNLNRTQRESVAGGWQDGSAGKSACYQDWQLKLDSQVQKLSSDLLFPIIAKYNF